MVKVYDTKVKQGDDIVKVFDEAYAEVVDGNPQGNGNDHLEDFIDEMRQKGLECIIVKKEKIPEILEITKSDLDDKDSNSDSDYSDYSDYSDDSEIFKVPDNDIETYNKKNKPTCNRCKRILCKDCNGCGCSCNCHNIIHNCHCAGGGCCTDITDGCDCGGVCGCYCNEFFTQNEINEFKERDVWGNLP